ncbi:hypothetical protein C0991_008236 [Blastosporella zonata]|nr:hypothetical protein C0991_008236 [Blastosporella zonata]
MRKLTLLSRTKHAYATSHLLPYLRPGARVLDIGSGSGYLAAVFYHCVGPTGKVVGVEHVAELAQWSVQNLRNDGLGKALDDGSIVIVTGDGREGYESAGESQSGNRKYGPELSQARMTPSTSAPQHPLLRPNSSSSSQAQVACLSPSVPTSSTFNISTRTPMGMSLTRK